MTVAFDGFWSYVHLDDEAEYGYISTLAGDLTKYYEALTGEKITLFLDKEMISWGDDWQQRIDASLSSVAFFVPVLTPRYFQSTECRRELNFFARKADQLGVKELVLPILWIDVPELTDSSSTDELVRLANKFQRSDWRVKKFAEVGSGEYRRSVAELAERLLTANKLATQKLDTDIVLEILEIDETPGSLEMLAEMELSLPELHYLMNEISACINSIGAQMQTATLEVRSGKSQSSVLAARLRIARTLSQNITTPTEEIGNLGNNFFSVVNKINDGVNIIFENIQLANNSEQDFDSFLSATGDLVIQSEEAMKSLQGLMLQFDPLEKLSRDLRPPLRVLRQGLNQIIGGLELIITWKKYLNLS